MKRIALSIYLMTFTAILAMATPAFPGKITHVQSDGSVVTFQVMGDEFNNHIVVDGLYTAIMGSDGDLYYARLQNGYLESSGVKIKSASKLTAAEKNIAQQSIGIRKMVENPIFNRNMHSPERAIQNKLATMNNVAPNEAALEIGDWGGEIKGKRNMLVILVEYTDIKFSIENPQAKFHDLLNQPDYSEDGGTGCAADYFKDASNGEFEPVFDVVGPFCLSENRFFYGGNVGGEDQAPAYQAMEACNLADSAGVDFSKYDNDGDGKLDLVFVVYAGHNPAEGGPADAVWPHKWDIMPGINIPSNSFPRYDGKQFTVYACTSELKGRSGVNMTGIGSFCHEFSHAIGLPDWYDTANNVCFGMDYASIMHAGNYLNNSRTPPTYNLLERWLLGWALPKEIHSAGSYEIEHVSTDDGYIMWANESKTECFLFESRTKAANFKWDKYLNGGDDRFGLQGGDGMLIYHVDWDRTPYNGSTNAYAKWVNHTINTDPAHQCATIFRANPTATTEQSKGWFFPGSRNITTLSYETTPTFQNWDFERMPYYIDNIKIDGSKVSFKAMLKDLTMDARQYDALIDWESSDYEYASWRVEYINERTGEKNTITTTNKYVMLYPLEPETAYSALVYGDGAQEPVFEFNFDTMGSAITPRAALFVNAEQDSKYQTRLSVKNLESTPEQIQWYVDGKSSEAYVYLTPGKHQICAVITDTDGNTQYLYRYVNVK
ncbi:MAG: M6 family metalloprotease domain-containing protein [Tidjanibacter sp.]|nr:M6 family metalloprotease domain-containing protein [Tidjanibacter sp.]